MDEQDQWLGYRVGDRIVLVATADPDTALRPGDRGTITGWNAGVGQLWVDWDHGSRLMMLIAAGRFSQPGEPLDQVRHLRADEHDETRGDRGR